MDFKNGKFKFKNLVLMKKTNMVNVILVLEYHGENCEG